MPRPLPSIEPSAAVLGSRRSELLQVDLSVVTPLFGGGAVPRMVDPIAPVRGSSVRGQLRFWWRACNAARFADVQALFREEAAIWGRAHMDKDHSHSPSSLDVQVEVLDAGRPVRQPDWRRVYPAYALFPFQIELDDPDGHPPVALEGVRFRLTLNLAPHVSPSRRIELLEAAEGAVWAWIVFGGLGARTRRGCGSLYCEHEVFRPPATHRVGVSTWLQERLDQHIRAGVGGLLLPQLDGARRQLAENVMPTLQAWREAIRPMQDFRQQPGLARNPGSNNRPGRSLWPEADSIREALRINDPRHPPSHRARPYYPRADLGLPIVFQRLAHRDIVLEGSVDGSRRMASPIVLKPLAVALHRAIPLALELRAPHVWESETPDMQLGELGTAPVAVPADELDNPARSKQVEPLRGQQSARDAFWAYLKTRWR